MLNTRRNETFCLFFEQIEVIPTKVASLKKGEMHIRLLGVRNCPVDPGFIIQCFFYFLCCL